jgi:hypothetical protein
MKAVSLLSEEQSQKAIQIFSKISPINEDLISLCCELMKQIKDESLLISIWKNLFSNYSTFFS